MSYLKRKKDQDMKYLSDWKIIKIFAVLLKRHEDSSFPRSCAID